MSASTTLRTYLGSLCCRDLRLGHVADDGGSEFAGLYFLGAVHLASEVVGYDLLRYGAFQRVFNEACGFRPSHEVEHHDAGKDDRAGVHHVAVSILGRSAVRRLKNGVLVTDVAPRGDPQP